jgi:hypothetical protein
MNFALEQFLSDIPASLARGAFNGTSFNPEARGDRTRQDYAATMAQDYADLHELAERNSTLELLPEEFARYRQGYQKRYTAYLHSSSRCVSSMIVGPSNFPAYRMNKRADIAHKRMGEFLEFRERALKTIRKTLSPCTGPIMAGDSDAVQRLQANIAEAEQMQARMKVANLIVRKYVKKDRAQGVTELVTQGFSEVNAQKLFQPDFCGRLGFSDYALTNNSANIRRMKARLEQISSMKKATGFEAQGEKARLEDAPSDNRVRLFFPSKPSEEVRTRLKANGFRWSPTIGAWQAYRNQRTYDFAKQEAVYAARAAQVQAQMEVAHV